MESAQSQRPLMVKVWLGLLGLTLIEVLLAYIHVGPLLMLSALMTFSVVKAVMIMAYFMHLKYDKPALTWMLAPALVACILILMAYLLPDGYLLLENRP
ncbi:MAG: hypothetical protein GC160_26375 [Acidobacteria bacterium]|nr:hypothetical protein [Acidobacteriota bacterium]